MDLPNLKSILEVKVLLKDLVLCGCKCLSDLVKLVPVKLFAIMKVGVLNEMLEIIDNQGDGGLSMDTRLGI